MGTTYQNFDVQFAPFFLSEKELVMGREPRSPKDLCQMKFPELTVHWDGFLDYPGDLGNKKALTLSAEKHFYSFESSLCVGYGNLGQVCHNFALWWSKLLFPSFRGKASVAPS
ncbi:MAG: hypothetical protein CM15mP13_0350 [Pseudomonadota bacterium]|nr:MAG: hypothetical protein CM15mP13_0350 [Pseudomonadota bacterium]